MSRCWKSRRIFLSALLPLLLLSPAATAQDLQGLKDAVEDHYAAGRYAETEAEAKRLLPLLERQYSASHEAVMEIMDRLAWALYRQKRYEEAAQLHRRVIDVRRKTLGDRHALVARSLDGLARALWDLGRKDESKALSKQGIAALPPGFDMPGVADLSSRTPPPSGAPPTSPPAAGSGKRSRSTGRPPELSRASSCPPRRRWRTRSFARAATGRPWRSTSG